MKKTRGDDRLVVLLALTGQWMQYDDRDDQPPEWWLRPRQIDAIAGHFDAPTRSDNDPTGRLAQMALFAVLVCAIYRANLRGILVIPSQIRANPISPGISRQPAPALASPTFFVFFSLCQINPPHTLTGAVLGLRGGYQGFSWDLFAGRPISKPEGFQTAERVLGCNFNWSL